MPETVANDAKPKPAVKILASDPYSRTIGEQWKQNRCTQLLGFACLVFIFGACYLLYSQNRFVPVDFPSGDSIQAPAAALGEDIAIPPDATSIVVVGAQNDRGVLRVAIYDTAKGFNNPVYAVHKTSLQIQNGEAVAWIPVNALPESFAVAVFHDENGNGDMDRNRFEIPSERYGFSNNARGMTGPPSYEDAKIDRPKARQSINISIR